MRDSHRMKEKYDLSLDSRQVVSLVIGAIIVAGSVFVLGVVVGKNLAGNEQAQEAPDLLAALDQKANVALTFQDELTKKAPPPSAHTAPAPPPPAPVQIAAARDPEAKPAPSPVPAPAPAPAAVVKPATLSADLGEPRAAVARAEVPAPASSPSPAEETPTRTGGLKDAFARATAPTPAAGDTDPDGAWTLQLSASQSRDEADRFAAKLRERGYAPYIVSAQVEGKGTWFRVRMGSFKNREAAQKYLVDFKRETQLDAFVATR